MKMPDGVGPGASVVALLDDELKEVLPPLAPPSLPAGP